MNEQDFYNNSDYLRNERTENAYQSSSNFNNTPDNNQKKSKKKKEKKGTFSKIAGTIFLGILFGGCAAGAFYGVNTFLLPKAAVETTLTEDAEMLALKQEIADLQSALNTVQNSGANASAMVVTDVTTVAENVMPSMVAVTNVGEYTTTDWFGRRYTQDSESCGSGIIIGESDEEYYIATNHHVIEDSKELTVLFVDDSSAAAYVKGYDSSIDIAVIAVSKSSISEDTKAAIKVATLGDSDSLKIGEPAIAIGNALGYGQSVTTGVISALDRDMTIDSVTYEDLIQTSAAINPGNSGGALLNVNGEVIGINSSKVGGDTVEGIGFAIPISEVKDILQEFSERETRTKVADSEKGYLGVTINSAIDPTEYGYPSGALVNDVSEGSGAAAAGIYKYDVITKVDGQTVDSYTELSECLSYYKAGETVTITVARVESGEMKYIDLEVTLGKRSE